KLLGTAKFPVRFHDDGHAGRTGVFAQFVESVANTSKRDLLVLAHVFSPFGRVRFVHLSRSTEIGNGKTGGREIAQRALQTRAHELRALWQVHLILYAAQFERGEAPLRGIPNDCVPVPLGAPKGRDGNWRLSCWRRW